MKETGSKSISQNSKVQKQLRIVELLVGAKAKGGVRSPHFWIIATLLAVFGYIYLYVLSSLYDFYIILFFYPLIYAALTYRLRGVLISGTAFLAIILLRAIILAHDTYSLVRLLLFSMFAFLVSGLVATLLNYLEQQLEVYKEILLLNEELNTYIDRLEKIQKQLIQAEKMNALGQLSASVAHEINNPLAGILVYSKLLAKKASSGTLGKEELLDHLAKIENATAYSSRIVHSLLDFARQTDLILKPVRIGAVVEEVISLVSYEAERKHITITREEKPLVPIVTVDFNQIQQVFVNLVVNAIQAMSEGGKLNITIALSEDGFVKTSFTDSGCGIPPENMDKLFTPFFTTKGAVKGVGLGLSVSYGVVERHGGRIEVQSEVGKGSTFTVYLPSSPQT